MSSLPASLHYLRCYQSPTLSPGTMPSVENCRQAPIAVVPAAFTRFENLAKTQHKATIMLSSLRNHFLHHHHQQPQSRREWIQWRQRRRKKGNGMRGLCDDDDDVEPDETSSSQSVSWIDHDIQSKRPLILNFYFKQEKERDTPFALKARCHVDRR